MNLCSATLAASFERGLLPIAAGVVFGLIGILGWGTLVETRLVKRTSEIRFSHCFLQGIVVTSFVLLAFSVAGVAAPAFWIVAGGGNAALAAAAVLLRQRGYRPDLSFTDAWPIWLLCLPWLSLLWTGPVSFGDTTAVWLLHAKELVCEPLFSAHYVNERVWAGSHSEYPLLYPLIQAYFFALTGSFRDDWLSIWQTLGVAGAATVGFDSVRRKGGLLAAFTAAVSFLAVAQARLGVQSVETCAVVFAFLIAASYNSGEYSRLPLYLLGLATTKNEGLAAALVFTALFLLSGVRGERVRRLRALRLWAALLGPWLLVLSRLPSYHEQYPSRLLSAAAWKAGWGSLPSILEGCLKIAALRPWRLGLLLLPLALIAGWKKRISPLLLAWPMAMFGVFLAVYVISPWGPKLYESTFDRLLAQIFPPLIVGWILVCASFLEDKKAWQKRAAVAIFTIVLVYDGVSVKNATFNLIETAVARTRAGDFGLAAYRKHPLWAVAFRLDEQLPPASRGAMINGDEHLTFNYMIYPRYVYPAAPDVVARTLLPWEPWRRVEEVPHEKYDFRFIIEGDRVLRRF